MRKGEYWVTSPYCYCHGAALFAVNGIRTVPAVGGGLGLAPLPGLSREETAILAAALLALAFFLFLLFFLCCCLCPGLWGRICACCCGSKSGAGGWKDSNRLHAVDYKLPRAWLDKFKGVSEDELDAKIHELESSGWGGARDGGLGSGYGYGAGGVGMGAAGAAAAHKKTAGRSRGGGSGVEDATGDFFFRGESLSRERHGDMGGNSGFGTGGSKVVMLQESSSRDQSKGQGYGGETTETSLIRRRQDDASTINVGTLGRLTDESGAIGGLKKVQVVKETNQRTTTKFDKSGNKETVRTTTTTYNNAGGLGSRLMDIIHGITGFGAPSTRQLSIKGRRSTSGGNATSGNLGRQTISGRSETFVSNLAEEGQISSSTMQGRQLSIKGTKGRKSMASGGLSTTSGSGQYMTLKSRSGGSNNPTMSYGLDGSQSAGFTQMTTGGTGDYLYQREIQREYNIHNPDSFAKLYNAYKRYLDEASFTPLK